MDGIKEVVEAVNPEVSGAAIAGANMAKDAAPAVTQGAGFGLGVEGVKAATKPFLKGATWQG